MVRGRTWKNINSSKAGTIKDLLLKEGAEEVETKQSFEIWRLKIKNCYITYYSSGTMYATPSEDPEVERVIEQLSNIVGHIYKPPTKEWCIGLDETGKGEIFGYLHVVGVVFHRRLFHKIEEVVGNSDTKRKHGFEYWQQLFENLKELMGENFFYLEERVSPSDIDEFNLNELLNVTYLRVLKRLTEESQIPPPKMRIVIDDYGVSEQLLNLLENFRKIGAEVIVSTKSEDEYLETRLAAIIAKWSQVNILEQIRRDFRLGDVEIGNGNANEENTIKWLQEWHKTGKPWPWFVRKSFRTVYKMDKNLNKKKKSHIFKK